jgi:hypothetical protein
VATLYVDAVWRYDDPSRLRTFPYVESDTIAGEPVAVSVYTPVESALVFTLNANRVSKSVAYDCPTSNDFVTDPPRELVTVAVYVPAVSALLVVLVEDESLHETENETV